MWGCLGGRSWLVQSRGYAQSVQCWCHTQVYPYLVILLVLLSPAACYRMQWWPWFWSVVERWSCTLLRAFQHSPFSHTYSQAFCLFYIYSFLFHASMMFVVPFQCAALWPKSAQIHLPNICPALCPAFSSTAHEHVILTTACIVRSEIWWLYRKTLLSMCRILLLYF